MTNLKTHKARYKRLPLFLPPMMPIPLRLRADQRFTGKGVTIAFIDSGFYPHPDLTARKNRILKIVDVTGQNLKNKDFEKIDAASWHGTMVACACAGDGYLSEGYYHGVARGSRVVLVKAFDGKKFTAANVARAIRWVTHHHKKYGIRVLNISLGVDKLRHYKKSKICGAIRKAEKLGIVVVVAAGNDPSRPLMPPSSCPSALTVGGFTDQNAEDVRNFSSYGTTHGRTLAGFLKPEVAAPGRFIPAPMLPDNHILREAIVLHQLLFADDSGLKKQLKKHLAETRLPKTLLKRSTETIRKSILTRMIGQKFVYPWYQHVDGTSFGAPIVSSVVAQMLEANPNLTPNSVKSILKRTATQIPAMPRVMQGYGAISAGKAVEEAVREPVRPGFKKTPQLKKNLVIFYYRNHDAHRVALVGDFNGWDRSTHLFKKGKEGLWRAAIPAPSRGIYRYRFLVDDTWWAEDPESRHKEPDGFGGMNDQLVIS